MNGVWRLIRLSFVWQFFESKWQENIHNDISLFIAWLTVKCCFYLLTVERFHPGQVGLDEVTWVLSVVRRRVTFVDLSLGVDRSTRDVLFQLPFYRQQGRQKLEPRNEVHDCRQRLIVSGLAEVEHVITKRLDDKHNEQFLLESNSRFIQIDRRWSKAGNEENGGQHKRSQQQQCKATRKPYCELPKNANANTYSIQRFALQCPIVCFDSCFLSSRVQ